MILADLVDYLYKALVSTATQFLILFGPVILLAILMNIISAYNVRLGCKVLGENAYQYIFRWLGTIIHETGHALFAILFGHRITEFVLFSHKTKGTPAHVTHTYNHKNIYQNIGNFFIGIGPLILGSLMLFLITWILYGINVFQNIHVPDIRLTAAGWPKLSSIESIGLSTWHNLLKYGNIIIAGPEWIWWKTTLLIYFLYSVSSSITLSVADVKGAAKGLAFTLMVLLAFNLSTLWMGNFAIDFFIRISRNFAKLYFLILLTIAINVFFIAVLFFIILLKSAFRH